MIQMNILSHQNNEALPCKLHIDSITINPEEQINCNEDEQESIGKNHDDSFEVISLVKISDHPLETIMKQNESVHNKGKRLLTINQDIDTNTIYCDGIQITNMTCGNRSENNKLDNVIFVSYIENELTHHLNSMSQIAEKTSVVDAETRVMCQTYLNKCKKAASLILQRIKQGTTGSMYALQQDINDWEINEPILSQKLMNDGKLLKVLLNAAQIQQMGHNYLKQIRHILIDDISVFKALQQDKIINQLPYECNLRSTVDTVLENVNHGEGRTLRVLEISCSYNHFYGVRLNKIMSESYPDVEVDYKFASVLNNSNKQSILDDLHETLSFPVHHLDWNLLKNGSLQPIPKYLKNFDLVILNSSLDLLKVQCNEPNRVNEWISECIMKTMKPQGFLMIHEFTENVECAQTLLKLERILLDSNEMSKLIKMINLFRKY